mmetsp:Transcript_1622/g.3505  ORF Transcript_1622/g.3505 Transcript_1622/m.3505 type:complete len:164 (+) Transcript_1622:61-552(+)
MLGLDAAGKSTILRNLCHRSRQHVKNLLNIEFLEHGKTKFTTWDLSGPRTLRILAASHYLVAQALVFVIDSSDPNRLDEANEELQRLLNIEALRGAPLLVWANNSDLPNAMPIVEIVGKLGLNGLRMRNWNILRCCAQSGEGLKEGVEWLQSFSTGAKVVKLS